MPTCIINDQIPVAETENSIYTLRHIYIALDEHEKLFFTPHSYYSLEDGWTFKYIHWGGAMREQYTSHLQKKNGPMMIPTSRRIIASHSM